MNHIVQDRFLKKLTWIHLILERTIVSRSIPLFRQLRTLFCQVLYDEGFDWSACARNVWRICCRWILADYSGLVWCVQWFEQLYSCPVQPSRQCGWPGPYRRWKNRGHLRECKGNFKWPWKMGISDWFTTVPVKPRLADQYCGRYCFSSS